MSDFRHVGSTRDESLVVDAQPGGLYEIAVVPRAHDGGRGRIEDATRIVKWSRGRRRQPGNVAGLRAQLVQGVVVLQWDAVDEPDVAGYEIKAGPRWTGGLPVARGVAGTVYVLPADFVGTRTYRIKALNREGVASDYEATASLTVASTHFAAATAVDSHTGWGGTKTNMAVSGSYLRLSVGTGLSGSYQAATINPGALADYRLVVGLETDIEDVELTGARIQVRGDSPYLQRRMGDELTNWEGTENNDMGAAAALLMPGDDFYLAVGRADQIYDFPRRAVTFLVEYRVSVDAGTNYGDWTTYQPGVVANCDRVQVRVSLSTVHAEIVPRLRTLTVLTCDPVPDSVIPNDEWVREFRFDRVARDPNTGTFAVADASISDATVEAGHAVGVNLPTAQTTKVAVDFRVPEDLDLTKDITAEAAGRLSGAPAATANLRLKYVFRYVKDNQAYASGGTAGSVEVTKNIGSGGTGHSSADLCVVELGTVIAGGAIADPGYEVSAAIIRLAAASSEYGGTFQLTRLTLRGKRKKR